ELATRTFLDITYPEDLAQTRTQIQRLLDGEVRDCTIEKRHVTKDGTCLWTSTTVGLLRMASGAPERFIGVIEDISQRKLSEERERENAQRMQLALSAGQLGDWSWDAATDLVTLGTRAASIYRMARATVVSWPQLRELLHLEDREPAALAMQTALSQRTDYDFEFRLNPTSGEDVWIGARGQGIYTAAGIASGMIGVVADITEKKRLELAQNRLAAIIESSDDAIVSKDLDGTVRTWNSGAQRVFGYTAAEMIGKPITKLIPSDLRDEETRILQRQRNGERVDHYETVRLTKDGRKIDVSLTVSPIRDSSGRIVGASKVARDITARKMIEVEIRRSEEELRALADTIPQLAWMAKPDGSIFWFNQGWYEYTGTTPEQVEGWGWESIHDASVLPRVLELWRQSLQTGVPFEMDYPLRGSDGRFRWFLTRVRPIRDASGALIRWIGTSTDVDEVKRAQEALAEESRLLNLLNETGKSIAADLDLQTLVQKITDATTQISGAEFGAFFYSDKDEAGDSFQLFTLSGADIADFERFGQPRATPLFSPTFQGKESIRIDDVLQDERYGKWGGLPSGHLPVRSYLATSVVSRNGEVIGGLLFGHSTPGVFTERVERIITGIAAQAAVAIDNARLYERVKRDAEDRQQLLEAERSARAESERVNFMKDEFLATLSHELRTPLNAIVGWSQVLRMRGHADPEVLEGLSVIDRNARVQAQLIEDLLDMSRIISGKVRLDVQRVDVQDVVRAAIASVRHSADSKSIRIQV
ncbi:MAG: PAS domain S-box protein, partial [Planctomycetota bacterium]